MLLVIFSTQLVEFGDRILYSRQTSRASFYEYPPIIDELPLGSVIVNLGSRTWSYPLSGTGARNSVISYLESLRLFANPSSLSSQPIYGDEASPITLSEQRLRLIGATHLFTVGQPQLVTDPCVSLNEIGRIDRNPLNGVELPKPRVLYEIRYCH